MDRGRATIPSPGGHRLRLFLGSALARALETLLGRRNLYRLGRFLSREARLDSLNQFGRNGEERVQDQLASMAPGGPRTILDVGANVGEWSRTLAARLRAAGADFHIHAFEPCAGTRTILGANLVRWGLTDRVTVVPRALAGASGTRTLHVLGAGEGTNSLVSPPNGVWHPEEVTCITLDDWREERGVGDLFHVKIDAEGADLEVMRGARRSLENGRIERLQFEYNHRWIQNRHVLLDVFELLAPMEYRLGKITPRGIEFYSRWHPELENYREGNYLVVRRDLAGSFPAVTGWENAPG